jgi:predicted transcriptional regulator
MRMSLTAMEREVIINWNDAEDYCTIYTASRPTITKCQKAGFEVIEEYKSEGKVIAIKYKCHKSMITIRSKKRVLSKEKRKEISDRMKHTWESKSM